MVFANGSFSLHTVGVGEGEIRKNIIQADLMECIVVMSAQLFIQHKFLFVFGFCQRIKIRKEKHFLLMYEKCEQ